MDLSFLDILKMSFFEKSRPDPKSTFFFKFLSIDILNIF